MVWFLKIINVDNMMQQCISCSNSLCGGNEENSFKIHVISHSEMSQTETSMTRQLSNVRSTVKNYIHPRIRKFYQKNITLIHHVGQILLTLLVAWLFYILFFNSLLEIFFNIIFILLGIIGSGVGLIVLSAKNNADLQVNLSRQSITNDQIINEYNEPKMVSKGTNNIDHDKNDCPRVIVKSKKTQKNEKYYSKDRELLKHPESEIRKKRHRHEHNNNLEDNVSCHGRRYF